MRAAGLGIMVVLAGFLFARPTVAEEPAASPAVPAAAVAEPHVWLDDELPANAKVEGNWSWQEALGASGLPAGQAGKVHGHPSAKGMNSHGFSADPMKVSANQMLTQQVWLDPADPPRGIMLKFKLSKGSDVGVYWEGEQEVFTPAEDEEVWYYGLLPELGKWTTLEVLAEDLGIEDQSIVGMSFVTFDGKALWDKTTIAPAPPLEDFQDLPGSASDEETPAAPGATETEKVQ